MSTTRTTIAALAGVAIASTLWLAPSAQAQDDVLPPSDEPSCSEATPVDGTAALNPSEGDISLAFDPNFLDVPVDGIEWTAPAARTAGCIDGLGSGAVSTRGNSLDVVVADESGHTGEIGVSTSFTRHNASVTCNEQYAAVGARTGVGSTDPVEIEPAENFDVEECVGTPVSISVVSAIPMS